MKKLVLLLAFISLLGLANAQWISDTVTFESPATELLIDTNSSNLWQIGKPQKIFFDSAYSKNNAIVTDTLNNYPPNDTSSFIFIIRHPYTQTCRTCLNFWHKYDMDTLGDKGIIEASYDGGNSWLLLKDTANNSPIFIYFNWDYDFHLYNETSINHKLITSGKSDGWIQSSICWVWRPIPLKDTIILNPDSLMIRFTFISDSITKNKEGWMIDNIVALSLLPESCYGGIKENPFKENISVYPNPASNNLTIETPTHAIIEISNIQGQLIKTLAASGTKTNIDVSSLPCGVYVVQVKSEKGVAVKKFVKE